MTAALKTAAPSPTPEKVTPMMAQYLAVKEAHPGLLLFYRMGDFYELFFDDALQASKALDIALTRRGQHQGQDIPMCGVPVHSHTGYVARLIRAGFRVAICEQTETPEEAKKRGGKSLVERKVIRIITPGTLTEDSLLESTRNNYLLAMVPYGAAELALAWCDLSTGAFELETIERDSLSATLARLSPGELYVPEALLDSEDLGPVLRQSGIALTLRPASTFDSINCTQRLLGFFGAHSTQSWGEITAAESTAAGALLDYVLLTQVGAKPLLTPPKRALKGGHLQIDSATRRNLELMQTTSGERKGSLLSTIDHTVSAAGGRLLATRLSSPLTDLPTIQLRHDSVAWGCAHLGQAGTVRDLLKQCPDLERALARLSLGRGGPRDLAALRDSLMIAQKISLSLPPVQELPAELAQASRDLIGHSALIDELSRALATELPLLARDGGFIAQAYSAALDEIKTLRDDGRRLMMGLQNRYAEETGLSGLKIKHNNIIGYHIELPPAQAEKLMSSDKATSFIHRQTMATAMRFTTSELIELEKNISQSAERALAMELELFAQLLALVQQNATQILLTAHGLAVLDVSLALATLASRENWCRPTIDNSLAFDVQQGRHPVVEAALKAQANAFTSNSCSLDPTQRLWLLTGPNMAGKSTFLRQNALIVVLAQMGSFVPAQQAHIGVVDRLFSRVGASDDLARGQSTFMVEMVETATILNLSTARSLVILDEIGRGTATYDGLAIAWAVVEHLHNVLQCRALFATHYHELTTLQQSMAHLSCHTMKVKEWQGNVVFLHEIIKGAADRSYGIHVAQLAGLPAAVIQRAKSLLSELEKSGSKHAGSKAMQQAAHLPLFESPQQPAAPDHLREKLATITPDTLTPREALDLLYQLKSLAHEKDPAGAA
jgi:DNA mismatch repair protein MutS